MLRTDTRSRTMFLREHIVMAIMGLQLCHDRQVQENKAAEGRASTRGGIGGLHASVEYELLSLAEEQRGPESG